MFVPAMLPGSFCVGQTVDLPEISVTASHLGETAADQTQAVTVLEGPELRRELEATLGETLSRQPGVRSTYFGPASSRPVIRGLDGDRIRILQNGLNTIDASATSFDHAVSFDPVSVSKIEIVRGPATVLFGPNAIGGVVNATDNRIPTERIDEWLRGSVGTRASSADHGLASDFVLEGGAGGFAWHVEGFKRNVEDLGIPGRAESRRFRQAFADDHDDHDDHDEDHHDHHHDDHDHDEDHDDHGHGRIGNSGRGKLKNSHLNSEGFSIGGSYFWDGGYFGLAYSGFDADYGSPAEEDVTIGLRQRRWDFRGALFDPFGGIEEIHYRFAFSDYEHTEFHDREAGTRFTNDGYDGRIEARHKPLGMLQGTFGYQVQRSEFEAAGIEKFLPQVLTRSHSAFVFEEMKLADDWRLEAGLRYDHTSTDAAADPDFGPDRTRTFDALSGSFGIVYSPNEDYVLALSSSRSERAPTYQELYAGGPHVATGVFEAGDDGLPKEKSLGFDLSLRKKTGRVTGAATVFYNRFDDYIGLFATGESDHGMPVHAYRNTDAEFYGAELEAVYHFLGPVVPGEKADEHLNLELRADTVRAKDRRSGDPLPRISPVHVGVALDYRNGPFGARVESIYSASQSRTADNELPTDSYVKFNAALSYTLTTGAVTTDFYVKGVNLTNEEVREHTSFLKDVAPLSGRGVVAGVKVSF